MTITFNGGGTQVELRCPTTDCEMTRITASEICNTGLDVATINNVIETWNVLVWSMQYDL